MYYNEDMSRFDLRKHRRKWRSVLEYNRNFVAHCDCSEIVLVNDRVDRIPLRVRTANVSLEVHGGWLRLCLGEISYI